MIRHSVQLENGLVSVVEVLGIVRTQTHKYTHSIFRGSLRESTDNYMSYDGGKSFYTAKSYYTRNSVNQGIHLRPDIERFPKVEIAAIFHDELIKMHGYR